MQKPAALFKWILSLPWMPTGCVADPYMGCGPCGVACACIGRGYIGIEKERKYFDIAVKRIKDEANRLPLFEPKRTATTKELFT
jgi:site-specific DNA-methyltransferase (adenine-specific)/modification methylase